MQPNRRRKRDVHEKRLGDLAVQVLGAICERHVAVADADRRAGQALREMTQTQGLSFRETVEWCGEQITTREVTRLRRLAEDDKVGKPKVDTTNSAADAVEELAQRATRAALSRARSGSTRIDSAELAAFELVRLHRFWRLVIANGQIFP